MTSSDVFVLELLRDSILENIKILKQETNFAEKLIDEIKEEKGIIYR